MQQRGLEQGLTKGVAPRKAIVADRRLDHGELAAARPGVVMTAVTGHHILEYLRPQADGLHGAQRLVVYRHRTRLGDGALLAVDDDSVNARLTQHIGQRQADRAGTDNDDRRAQQLGI